MEETTIHPRSEPDQPTSNDEPRLNQADPIVGLDPDSIVAMLAAIRDEILCDEQGPIPTFPSARLDEQGRLIHPSPEERQAREDAYQRRKKLRRAQPVVEEPPGLDEAIMRGIDSHREEGMKLFEGYY